MVGLFVDRHPLSGGKLGVVKCWKSVHTRLIDVEREVPERLAQNKVISGSRKVKSSLDFHANTKVDWTSPAWQNFEIRPDGTLS